MSYIDQFYYQLSGPENGTPWVFLHGLMGYALNWRRVTAVLEKSERVLAYDQRGHGKSMKPLTGYDREDYADDLYLILQDLGWEKIRLVGHSMGEKVALNFAFRFPEKVEKLVIEDIGPDIHPKTEPYYRRLIEMVPTPFVNKREAKQYFETIYPQKVRTKENAKQLAQYLFSNIEDKSNGTADWRFHKEGVIASIYSGSSEVLWNEVKSLSCPTLVIRGAQSHDLSHETWVKMQEANPQVKGIEIPDSGHWVHFDQAEAFTKAIFDFCKGIP